MKRSASEEDLVRGLGPWSGGALVIGSVLGTGVFLKTAGMAQHANAAGYVMAAWVVAGLLSLTGALLYAELGARFPRAGGEYVYLREAFGDLPAFLFGWTRFCIVSPGSIAAYAVGSATFLAGIWIPPTPAAKGLVAVGLIVAFTAVNCLSVRFSGGSGTILTGLKIAVILGLAAGVLGTDHAPALSAATSLEGGFPGLAAMGSTVLAALWAYDGWNNLAAMGGEMKEPERNIPRALGLGMLVIILVYVAANVAYFAALPFDEIATASSDAHPHALPVATKTAATFLGPAAVRILALALVLSALGAMHGQVLSGARVPYAMARDGLFFRPLGELAPRTKVPVRAVIVQSAIAVVFALSGTFDQLTESVVFASWIFYGATTLALFKFRRGERVTPRTATFRVPGYPQVPIVFLFLSALLVANTLATSLVPSLGGLGLIALGVPVFHALRARAVTR